MASGNKKNAPEKMEQGKVRDKSASDYYKLNRKAVDDLVNADVSNSPKVSAEEIARISGRSKNKLKIPMWLKVVFVKFWFAAATCFFFIWGLGGYVSNLIDQLFVIGVATGLVTDLLTNNMIRYIEVTDGENDRWMLFPQKKYAGFVCNVVYGFVVTFCVYTLYNMVNLAAMRVTGNTETLFLGVEPIMYGIFSMGADMMFVGMKQFFLRIVEDARKDNRQR